MIKLWVILLLARIVTGHCRTGLRLSVVCENTTLEDYAIETMELEVWKEELSIQNSKIPLIYRMLDVDDQSNYTKISVNFCEVQKVESGAFGDFHWLQEIHLGFNQISDLTFVTNLPKGVSVNLTRNLIEVVDFASFNGELSSLDLSFNRIVLISLCLKESYLQFPVLNNLYLNDNKITELELGTVTRLDLAIYIFNNNITRIKLSDIDTTAWPVLRLLDLSNSITNLSMLPKPYWRTLQINVSNNNLKRLENDYGFSYTKYILDFSNCSLEYINPKVFQRTSFDALNLSYNMLKLLSPMSFAQSSIDSLDLSHNRIESIASVFDSSRIRKLNLSRNQIDEVNSHSFQNIKDLVSLDLSGNQKVDLKPGGFGTCLQLEKLFLMSCNLSSLIPDALEGLRSLVLLNLSRNAFKELQSDSFKHLTKVEQIDLSHNKLTVLPSKLFSFAPIRVVNLSGNSLSTIEPQAFYSLAQLDHLEINHNKGKLSVKNAAFSHMTQIREIQIKHCTLSNFSIQAFNRINNFEILNLKDTKIEGELDFHTDQHYINLKQLHLTLSELKTKTFTNLIYLQELYIWNSEIKTVEPKAFHGLYKLKTFHLPGSKVKELSEGALEGLFQLENIDGATLFNCTETLRTRTFKHLHRIGVLNLSWLQLKRIEPEAFLGLRRLKSLDLSGNQLGSLTFSGLEQLEKLKLRHNHLDYLERSFFVGLDNLKVLDLSFNNISDIDWGALQAFPNLVHLSVAHNNLTEFKVGAFSNLLGLKHLNLAHNSISGLLFESFLPLTSLESLNLEHNNLKTIEHISLASNLKSLKKIGIANNKWKCEYLAGILVTFRNRPIQYATIQPQFYQDNIDGIGCIDVCKYLLCLQDSHGIN